MNPNQLNKELKEDRNIAIFLGIFFFILFVLFMFMYASKINQLQTLKHCGSVDYEHKIVRTGSWLDEKVIGRSCCKETEGDYVFDKTTGKMVKEVSKDCKFIDTRKQENVSTERGMY